MIVSMIFTENESIFCFICRSSIECCFCSCPYCGEINNDDCNCKLQKSKNNNKRSHTKNNSKYDLSQQSKTFSFMNRNDDWWRLEKWHIGRKNFP